MHGRIPWLLALALPLIGGCVDTATAPPTTVAPADEPAPPARYDPATAGAITGQVRWRDAIPQVAPFRSIENPLTDQVPPPVREWPNPNAPRLHPSGGVGSAVVFLRGVDPARARPWPHPPVTVELRGQQFRVTQGGQASNVGFVRVGGGFDMVSRDRILHMVQARGAVFFSRSLPEPDTVRTCRLDRPGLVELVSGSGYHWMRAYLFVDQQPYYTRTDAEGRFRLDGVPAGRYQLVAWHPSWAITREERNPDLFRVQQVRFGPPLETMRSVEVTPGGTATVDLDLHGPPSSALVPTRTPE